MGSFCAAYLETKRIGVDRSVFYFNDTLVEDADLYRFLVQTVCWFHNVKPSYELLGLVYSIPDLWYEEERKSILFSLGKLLEKECKNFFYDADGRNIFDVFYDEKYLANSRVDVCSRILKRDLSKTFCSAYDPTDWDVVVGFDWAEIHRLERAIPNWEPFTIRSPMCPHQFDDDTNWIPKSKIESEALKISGIKKPNLYQYGFPHNNCSGFCVKAGLAQFRLLYEEKPAVYRYFELKQEKLHQDLPRTKPFLKKSINKVVHYLTLKQYREQYLETDSELSVEDRYDFGGCGCAI